MRKWKRPRRRQWEIRRFPGPPLWYKVDPQDSKMLILKNGTRIRQCGDVLHAYCTQGMKFYSLSRKGLRKVNVQIALKNNYCKKTRSNRGNQGQHYPHIAIDGKKYPVHHLMILAWCGPWDKSLYEVDHINGNISDWRLVNLRVIPIELNYWCGGIIRRLRNAARKFDLPMMDPAKREPEDMLALFERFAKHKNLGDAVKEEVERQKVLHTLRKASRELHDPSLDPDTMTPERREEILSKYRVEDPGKRMEWEMTHHCEC